MADDGATLSLDDYIKVKRKQGGFKTARGRGGGGVKSRTQQRRKGGATVGGTGRNVRVQYRGQQTATQAQRGRNRQLRGRRARGNRFNNVITVVGSPRRAIAAGRGRNRGGGGRQNFQRRNQGQVRPLMSTDFGQVQRRRQPRNTRGFGISQNLSNRNEYARVPRIQFQNIQNPRRINIVRPTNRRAVMKFAKKRVQRARLQLTKRIAFRPNANRRAVMPLLSVTSGVRRTRTGFVTVGNPVEKQIQRLVIKEKIQKARQIRNNNIFSSSNRSRNTVNMPGSSHQQFSPARNPFRTGPSRQQFSPVRNSYQQRARPRIDHNPHASLNQFERAIPTMGLSMYADREEMMDSPMPFGVAISSQDRWVPPPPLMRTAVNNFYDPTNPSMYAAENRPQALNLDIQRKINFIQNHRNRPTSDQREQAPILPDFRAPIASSTMKLGDRFKMYMQ